MTALDLMTDAQVMADAAANAEGVLLDGLTIDDPASALAIYDTFEQAARALAAAKKLLATKIGEAIGPEKQVLNGRAVKRHADMSRKNWDHDALLRMVLDSRLVDKDTGEMKEETDLEKVRSVWGLKGYQASITALRDRGLDPSEFCEQEFRGYRLADR